MMEIQESYIHFLVLQTTRRSLLQFGKQRYNNEGAYAILKSPDFASPYFQSFKSTERPMASTSSFSGLQDAVRPEFDFESLGIYNAPSWSVQLPDGSGGTQVVQVPRAPSVEGLPLPPNIQEPHNAGYEYLFELVAGLKHMIAARETENRAQVSALRSRARKHKGRCHSRSGT